MYHFEVSWGESPDLATVNETPSEPYVGLPWGVKLSDADLKSMLTVRASAESGGQSLRNVGLQLDHVCAAEGAMSAAEASAVSALMVERIVTVRLAAIDADGWRRIWISADFARVGCWRGGSGQRPGVATAQQNALLSYLLST